MEPEPDPCLGWLPGVHSACCGHGEPEKACVDPTAGWDEAVRTLGDPRHWLLDEWHVILERHRLRGEAALAFFEVRGCGPVVIGGRNEEFGRPAVHLSARSAAGTPSRARKEDV